jgi:fluoride exporter
MSRLHIILATAFGSALGGALRAALALWLPTNTWPRATFAANIAGCLLLGVVMSAPTLRDPWRWLLGAGLCGGLTTFSTLALESVRGVQDQKLPMVFGYISASLALGLAAVWLGLRLGRALTP